MDEFLAAQPAAAGHASGDAWMASTPKEMRGSLLKARDGKDFGGGARYATIRTHLGLDTEGGIDRLRVSTSGGHRASRLMTRAELAEVCAAVVVGVIADNSNAAGRAGMWADTVGGSAASIRLVAAEKEPAFSDIRVVTTASGLTMEGVISVEKKR